MRRGFSIPHGRPLGEYPLSPMATQPCPGKSCLPNMPFMTPIKDALYIAARACYGQWQTDDRGHQFSSVPHFQLAETGGCAPKPTIVPLLMYFPSLMPRLSSVAPLRASKHLRLTSIFPGRPLR